MDSLPDSPPAAGASKLEELRLENCVLGQIVSDLQSRLELAERRARQAETKCHAASRGGAAARGPSDEARALREQVEKLKRRCTNERVLLEQALRGKELLEAAAEEGRQRAVQQRQQHLQELDKQRQEHLAVLGRLRQEHRAELGRLREQQAADLQRMQRQLQGLESQRQAGLGPREAELLQAIAAESRRAAAAQERAAEVEGRWRQLEEEHQLAQAKLHAASLGQAQGGDRFFGGQQWQQQGAQPPAQQGQEGAQVLADLGDLEGITVFHCGSPARSCTTAGEAAQQLAADAHHEPGAAGYAVDKACWGGVCQGEELEEEEAQSKLHHPGPPPCQRCCSSAQRVEAGLQCQLGKLQQRNTQLQVALADTHLQLAQGQAMLQQEVKALQADAARHEADRDSARRQVGLLQEASAAAQFNEEALLLVVERLNEEVVDCALRMNQALEQNAALLQEKQGWLRQLECQEREMEACKEELHTARLQQARLLHPGAPQQASPPTNPSDSQVLVPSGSSGPDAADPHEQLLQHLVEMQAQEAALRSVLGEVRREQLATCKAVGNELRRVLALEKLRLADMREGQRLQRRVGELQKEVTRLYAALAEARLQLS